MIFLTSARPKGTLDTSRIFVNRNAKFDVNLRQSGRPLGPKGGLKAKLSVSIEKTLILQESSSILFVNHSSRFVFLRPFERTHATSPFGLSH